MSSIFENNVVVLHNVNFPFNKQPAYKPVFGCSHHIWDETVPSSDPNGENTTGLYLSMFFDLFNGVGNYPLAEDYYAQAGRSLSVSDIVVINGHYYRCESVGWTYLGTSPCLPRYQPMLTDGVEGA